MPCRHPRPSAAQAPTLVKLAMPFRLMTLHKGKELEFRHVFLPAWENGIFPPTYAGDLAEERRPAYVALTRSMSRVTISHCRFRHGFATPSCFLDDIPQEHRSDSGLHSKQNRPPPRQRRFVALGADMEPLQSLPIERRTAR